MLLTLASMVVIPVLTLVFLSLYLKRTLPNILEDVAVGAGESISESLNETLANPNVKRAMSILGKNSGDARADTALRNKAATAIVGQSPVVSMALEKIGISPLEGVKLLNDPLFGPWIKQIIGSFVQGSEEKKEYPGQTVGRM